MTTNEGNISKKVPDEREEKWETPRCATSSVERGEGTRKQLRSESISSNKGRLPTGCYSQVLHGALSQRPHLGKLAGTYDGCRISVRHRCGFQDNLQVGAAFNLPIDNEIKGYQEWEIYQKPKGSLYDHDEAKLMCSESAPRQSKRKW